MLRYRDLLIPCLFAGACGAPVTTTAPDMSHDFAAPLDFVYAPNIDMADGCVDAARVLYIADREGTLSRFDPQNLSFRDIGKMNCPTTMGNYGIGMALDRKGIAWVVYTSGELFKVDTRDASCTKTGFMPNQLGFYSFEMAFAASAPGSAEDVLYYATQYQGAMMKNSMGKVDLTTLGLTSIAPIRGYPALSGTVDGTLWGYFPDTIAPRVASLNVQTGAEGASYQLPQLAGAQLTWAFAVWGGDFWIFLAKGGDASSRVYHLRADGKTLTLPLASTGRHVVAAASSVCAPTVM